MGESHPRAVPDRPRCSLVCSPSPFLLLLPLTARLLLVCLQIKHSTRLQKHSLAAAVLPGDMLLWEGLPNKEKEHQSSWSDTSAHKSGSDRDQKG